MSPAWSDVREWLASLALLVASSALSLLAALALLVVYLPVNPTVYALDPRCLHRLVPGAVKVFQHLHSNGGGRVTVRIDRQGFRGEGLRERSLVRRVVVYGDSFIEAETSPLGETLCRRLEQTLTRWLPGAPVEVVNAGVVGYGPDQVGVRLPDDVARLAPDLVVLALYGANDFGDLLRNKLYRLGDQGDLREQRPLLGPALRGHLARSAEGERVDGGSLRRLLVRLYWKLNPRVVERDAGLPGRGPEEGLVAWSLRACQAEYQSYVIAGDPEVVNLFADHYDADVALRPESEPARYKVALMQQVIRRIRSTLAERGVGLLLLLIPSAMDVCPDHHLKGVERELSGASRAVLTDVLSGIAERNGIPALNLFEAFLERSATAHLYYRDPETHWNAAGQELATRLTAERIRELNLLGRRPEA